jgi:hypothetical protein
VLGCGKEAQTWTQDQKMRAAQSRPCFLEV